MAVFRKMTPALTAVAKHASLITFCLDTKVTIDLDADRYRAIQAEAARMDRSVRDILDEALEACLMPTRRMRIGQPPRRL